MVVVVVGALASSPSAEAATRRAEPARRDHDTGEARRARAGATARRSEAEARSTDAARAGTTSARTEGLAMLIMGSGGG